MQISLSFVIVVALLVAGLLWLLAERGQLFLPSTLRLFREGGPARFLSGYSLFGYVYLVLQKTYAWAVLNVARPLSNSRLRNWLVMRYHSKVLTHQQARAIVSVKERIPLQDLEQIIPYPAARQILLEASPAITACECACRSTRSNPCQPVQVCLFVGQPFADFMLEHHPRTSKRLTQAEALELLDSEHARGHLHTAWFKNTMLDRFYVLCNCCKCCCGGLEIMRRYGTPTMASSGFVAQVDAALCAGCGACVEACTFNALWLADGVSALNWELCMGCGLCVDQCPQQALQLVRDERKGVPLEVGSLAREPVQQPVGEPSPWRQGSS